MVDLIVTEKPSVAKDLARIMNISKRADGHYANDKFWISWCIGHMAQLAEPQAYDATWKAWSRQTLPMIPETFKLEARTSARDQLNILKRLMTHDDVDHIINACDAGREGELIFRYVYDIAKSDKPSKRLWLASLTDSAVRHAYRTMKPGSAYNALGDAARCRSEADWLVGLNATRAMTLQCQAAGSKQLMSIGRVQTPTLAILVHREQEIEDFISKPFWQVFAVFDAGAQDEGIPTTYEGLWTKAKKDRCDTKEAAQEVLHAIADQQGHITKLVQKDVKERPPLLFDLTSLQRRANQRYGFSAQHTLDLAQTLYEKHKVLTYPRTDSNYLTTDMKAGLPKSIQAVAMGPYEEFAKHLLAGKLKTTKRIINNDEVNDHHAIIPTDKAPIPAHMSGDEKKLYDLVVRRFLAVFYPDAIFATTRIETKVSTHTFVTTGKSRKVAGWQAVEPPARYASDSKKRKKGPIVLPTITKGLETPVQSSRLHEGKTQAPKRYTESSLLGAMERAGSGLEDAELRRAMKEAGLGTPATRAKVFETLLKRDYIKRHGKMLIPTTYGRALVDALAIEDLKSPALTGQWEAKLSDVANGVLTRAEFMDEVRALTQQVTETILGHALDFPEQESDEEILGSCPVCSMAVTEGPKAYSCRTGRDCSFVIFKKVAGRSISKTLVKVLLSGHTSKVLKGFKSKAKKPFEAALKLNEEGRVVFDFDGQSRHAKPSHAESPKKTTTPCPKCAQGYIIRGRRGWGCSTWRQGCDFVVLYEQFGRTISDDEARALFTHRSTGVLDGFTQGGLGKNVQANIVLDLDVNGFIRLELA